MTNTNDNTTHIDPHQESQPMKTVERRRLCFGVIGASVNETRFPDGRRRYGVVFRREVSDLCLEGTFSMSLGQDELMDLVAAASTAYHDIDHLRFERRCSGTLDLPFDQLPESDGWDSEQYEFFPSQVEA